MSTVVERVELKSAVPPELAEKGWRLYMKDSSSPYEAENEDLDLATGGYPSKDEAISRARDMMTEEEEREAIADEGAMEQVDEGPATDDGAAVDQEAASHVEPGRRTLPVNSIRIDGGTQPRSALDMIVVAEYKDAMLNDAEFPPVDVFFDGKDFWLADGFHRLQARKEADVEKDMPVSVIEAEVKLGTKRDALLYALGANATHGLPRSREDKRRAVTMMLEDGEWTKFSDGVIAKSCNVSQPFVSKLRRELTTQNVLSEQPSRIGADGLVRDTLHIGKSAEKDDRQTTIADFGAPIPPHENESRYEVQFVDKTEWEPIDEADMRNKLAGNFNDVDLVVQALCGDHVIVRTPFARYRLRGTSGDPLEMPILDAEKTPMEPDPAAQESGEVIADDDEVTTPDGIVALLKRHGGVLMRMQLEEMGVSYAAIHQAIGEGVIAQPETGKFTLPDHKPQPSTSASATPTRSEPALPKTSIEDLLKGRKLSISFVWIPALKGKVNVTVNAGDKPETATRQLLDSDRVRGFHSDVQKMIVDQLNGTKTAAPSNGAARVVKKASPATTKKKAKKTSKRAPARKSTPTKKKAAKGRKR